MTYKNHLNIITMSFICLSILALAGIARGQSMYFENKQSGVLFSCEMSGSKWAFAIGGAASLSLGSVIDISFGAGAIHSTRYYPGNPGYYGGGIMIHPMQANKPHNFSLAPYFSFTHADSPNQPPNLSSSAFGFMSFYRQKISRINFVIFEAGIALVKSKTSSYYGYSTSKGVFRYNIGADFFTKFAKTNGVTVNPTISFVEDGDVVYGVNLGVLISGE